MNLAAASPVPSMDLVQPALEGKFSAIARLLTRAENGDEEVFDALGEIYRHTGKAHIVGLTGVPGSGKSTLMTLLGQQIRKTGRRVGIVAVDPTSPFSGGAILGDRIRMNPLVGDPGVFIRSMATRGALGGLARTTLDVVDVLDAAGFDMVFIETVGVGQDEIDIVQAAHTTVVISAPGLGDDVQVVKAGILEIADIHAVSKCDRSDANRTIIDLKEMLRLNMASGATPGWRLPVVATSAETGQGVDQLLIKIDAHRGYLQQTGQLRERRRRIARKRLLKASEELLRDEFDRHREGGEVATLVARLMSRRTHPNAAARELINQVRKEIRR